MYVYICKLNYSINVINYKVIYYHSEHRQGFSIVNNIELNLQRYNLYH